jgi:hypothetical protein
MIVVYLTKIWDRYIIINFRNVLGIYVIFYDIKKATFRDILGLCTINCNILRNHLSYN